MPSARRCSATPPISSPAPAARWSAASAYPFPGTSDFSSYLLQAQSSGAKVLAFANAGADTINSIKQAKEFGITKMQLAGLLLFISDVHSLGLETAQGIVLTDSFYWDHERPHPGVLQAAVRIRCRTCVAGMVQAGVYSSALHYLKAVADDGRRAGEARRRGDGRAHEGDADRRRLLRPRHDPRGRPQDPPVAILWEVKKPAESKGPWDYYKLLATVPADEAFRPINDGGCPLVKA